MYWDGCATLPRRPDGGIWVRRLKRPALRLSRKRWHERKRWGKAHWVNPGPNPMRAIRVYLDNADYSVLSNPESANP